MHKMSETPTVHCAQCPDQPLERQVSAAAFRLKGGGWYETDFKKDNQRNLVTDKAPDKPADKAPEKAADKPADKPAAAASPSPTPSSS